MQVKFKGWRELQREIEKKAKQCDKRAVAAVVRQNSIEMQAEAVKIAPVDTGELRRSITLKIQDGGQRGVVYPYMDYAPYVEFGTRFMLAKPYLGPAFKKQLPIFKRDLSKLVKK